MELHLKLMSKRKLSVDYPLCNVSAQIPGVLIHQYAVLELKKMQKMKYI